MRGTATSGSTQRNTHTHTIPTVRTQAPRRLSERKGAHRLSLLATCTGGAIFGIFGARRARRYSVDPKAIADKAPNLDCAANISRAYAFERNAFTAFDVTNKLVLHQIRFRVTGCAPADVDEGAARGRNRDSARCLHVEWLAPIIREQRLGMRNDICAMRRNSNHFALYSARALM